MTRRKRNYRRSTSTTAHVAFAICSTTTASYQRRIPSRIRRGARGAAIYRRHDRPAEGRDADARQSDGRLRAIHGDRDATDPAEHDARARSACSASCRSFHIYALSAVMLLGLRLGAELVLHPRFDPSAGRRRTSRRRRSRSSRRPDHVRRHPQYPGRREDLICRRSSSAAPAARRCRSRCSRSFRPSPAAG